MAAPYIASFTSETLLSSSCDYSFSSASEFDTLENDYYIFSSLSTEDLSPSNEAFCQELNDQSTGMLISSDFGQNSGVLDVQVDHAVNAINDQLSSLIHPSIDTAKHSIDYSVSESVVIAVRSKPDSARDSRPDIEQGQLFVGGAQIEMGTSHPSSDRYHCREVGCSRSFTKLKSLRRHARTLHSNARTIVCPYVDCEFARIGFNRKDTLLKHQRRKHGSSHR